MKLKGLSKLNILVITTNHANQNPHLLQKAPPPAKPPLPKVPPINGVSYERVPNGTATALPPSVTLLNSPNLRSLNSLRDQRKFHVASVGLPVHTTHFNVNFLSRIEFLQLNPSSCASIVSEGVMPLFSVNHSLDVQFAGNPITLHYMELQVFNHH